MKFHGALIAAASAAALVIPLGGSLAGAVTTTSLTVVDAYQYNSDNLMGHTVCLDGVVVHDGGVADPYVITSGISTTPGTHTVVVNDAGMGCELNDGSLTGPVTLTDTAAQTLVINWPDWSNQQDQLATTVLTDDVSCTPANTGRIVFRNQATHDGFVGTFGSTNGTEFTPLISNIAIGAEGVASVPAGAFPGPGSSAAGWDSVSEAPLSSDFTMLSIAAGSISTVYAIGGNDGQTGMVEVTRAGSVCGTTETTAPATTAPTTTAPPAIGARAATPVAAQPTYTG